MKRNILTILIFLFTFSLSAQNIKRAYKSLEKYEYEKAKEAFEKVLTENSQSVAANLGIALIKSDDKSPFFDIVDSWKYIELVKGHENELVQDEIDIIGEYFLNTETRKTSYPVKKKIEIAENAIEARLIKYIREENNLDAVYRVIELYPDYKHRDNVLHIRNQFEFRKYEKMNTLIGYEEFLAKFPDAAQVPKAIKYRDKMAFDDVKLKNTVLAYNQYIDKYPGSKFIQQAAKLRNAAAFTEAKRLNTLEAYQNFIKLYPDALEIPEARKQQHQLMYEKAKRIKSLEAYNEFIRMYPDGAYYIDVFNLKASDLGMQEFRQLGFESPDFKWAKALDNNEQIDDARSMALTNDGGIIIAGISKNTSMLYSEAWVVKLDSQGKMVWNKTIGQQYNEEILKVLVTPANEAVIVGYTQATADSNSFTGWMFKLGADGKKLWNKSLGIISIASGAIDTDGKVYISTYNKDTIPDKYFLQVYNDEGKKVGERDFVQYGTFNDVKFSSDGNCFLAGSKWFSYTDSKFYIKWEDTLTFGKLVTADLNNQYIAIAACDSINRYQLLYSKDGRKIWGNSVPLEDSTEIISKILLTDNNEVLLIGNNQTYSYIIKYDSKGNILANKKFYGTYRITDAIKSISGEYIYLFNGADYLTISFASVGF